MHRRITHVIPQGVSQLINVYTHLSLLPAVTDVEPGQQQNEEHNHDEVAEVGYRLQPNYSHDGCCQVEHHQHREQDCRGAGRREQVLGIILLAEVAVHGLNFLLKTTTTSFAQGHTFEMDFAKSGKCFCPLLPPPPPPPKKKTYCIYIKMWSKQVLQTL